MKRTILFALASVALLAVFGCSSEDSKPEITRMTVTPQCGVAPLDIETYGIASGGDESGDPTGGNNNLEFTWKFDEQAQASTSIAYHTYEAPGDYTVTLTVTDPNGETATASLPVLVISDSLTVTATHDVAGCTDTATPVAFDYRAVSCGVDPDVPADYQSLIVDWTMNDPAYPDQVYTGRTPAHTFSAVGDYEVELNVFYPAWAVWRQDTVTVSITTAAWLEASHDGTGGVDTSTPVNFDYRAMSCVVDPDTPADYDQLTAVWNMNDPAYPDSVFTGRNPVHTFSAAGDYAVELAVFHDSWATGLLDTVTVSVLP